MEAKKSAAYVEGMEAYAIRLFDNPYDGFCAPIAWNEWERGYQDARIAALKAKQKKVK